MIALQSLSIEGGDLKYESRKSLRTRSRKKHVRTILVQIYIRHFCNTYVSFIQYMLMYVSQKHTLPKLKMTNTITLRSITYSYTRILLLEYTYQYYITLFTHMPRNIIHILVSCSIHVLLKNIVGIRLCIV